MFTRKKKFFSRLNDEDITDNDYQHANHVWNAFNLKTLGEYSDLYEKTDVLLSDIFENFRSVCMKAYNLDPVWYYTAPGLSWDSMLKFTKVKIELLMDSDVYLFIEKGIRGGFSQCSHRYARANNKFLPNFEPSKPQNFLLYFDTNNLYGWSMSQYLPLNDFKWVDFLDVDNIDENGEKGYILEVNLEYPESLHDDHSDLPLAPESSVPPGCPIVCTRKTDACIILQRKNINDEEKTTLYLQILQNFVNFPYPSKIPDIMETVDTKQENYQNQSTDTVEDKINTRTSLSPKEHVITRPKEETSPDTIEEEIGSITPAKISQRKF
ncbi:uncharacterized protein TNCV_2812391 [Trichonephila clavipes]|nr:uncharacterized protein TNCV_2812391 [Trichonephila clavipes]